MESLYNMKRKSSALASALIVTLLLAGCAGDGGGGSVHYAPLSDIKLTPTAADEDAPPYKIGAGDELEVKFLAVPEINDRIVVAPDGYISLMFAPHIKAAGLTVEELVKNINKVLKPHVTQVDMVVVMRTFASQRVFVNGEVARPGPVQLVGNENVMQVLADSGWVTPAAGTQDVLIMRNGLVYKVEVSKLITGADMSQNVPLQGGDILLVPPSGIAVADRWVDQHIRQILPIQPGLSYGINNN
jgi:protein involved in polysaccharide export with SLBB domain